MRVHLLAFALITLASPCFAAIIPVPNGDFETAANNGSLGAGPLGLGLLSYDANVGAGPWRAEGHGIDIPLPLVPDLLAPITTINGGQATISGLTDVNIASIGILNNGATIYNNDIGATFQANTHYTLTAQFSSPTVLSPTVLSESAFGISLRGNGADLIASNTSPTFVHIDLLNAHSGTITLEYDSVLGDAGQALGISLFAGAGSGLANLSVLGSVSFDNVTLNAVPTAVPEPGTWAMLGLAAGSFGVWFRRKRARRDATAVQSAADVEPAADQTTKA